MNPTRVWSNAGFTLPMMIISNTGRRTEEFQGEAAKGVAVRLVHGSKATDALLEPSSSSVDHAALAVNVSM